MVVFPSKFHFASSHFHAVLRCFRNYLMTEVWDLRNSFQSGTGLASRVMRKAGHHNECLLVIRQAQRWLFSSNNSNQNRKARALQEISAASRASRKAGLC